MFTTTLSRPDLRDPAFERRWRAFAAAAGASFFQSWTWVGCLAAERYAEPVLAETTRGGATVGLALFSRRRDRPWGTTLYLHESGLAAWDSVFIEHNGPLVIARDPAERRAIASHLLAAVFGRRVRPRRMRLAGICADLEGVARALGGQSETFGVRPAPYVDLTRLEAGQPYLESLSRNTRQQVRRSNRLYRVRTVRSCCGGRSRWRRRSSISRG